MKFCQASGCSNPVFGKGFCRNHQYKREDFDKRSIVQRGIDKHKEQQKNRHIIDEVGAMGCSNYKNDMDLFWKRAASVIAKKPFCWECNEPISKSDYRSATAHIFPKSIFESVSDNEWNYLVLGARCGCHNKTHTMSTFAQMSIFPVAVQRYFKFGHLITEKHKYLDLFIEYANGLT